VSAPAAVTASATAAFAALCVLFVRQEGLGTFADDSVSYLVMAQVFSPWHAVSPAVADAFLREAFYPPLFSLLLAITGAAHDFSLAHAINAVLVAAFLPLVYLLGVRWIGGRAAAVAAMLAVALLPSLWIHARAILSEPLFGLLLLGLFWTLEASLPARRKRFLLSLILVALVLTRTAGLPLAVAFAAWALLRRGLPRSERLAEAMPGLLALVAYAAWALVRPAEATDINAFAAGDRIREIAASAQPLSLLAAGTMRQLHAMGEAWTAALLLFWVEGQPARPLLAAVAGALALGGLVQRFAAGRADAWIAAAYLGLYLLWPFQDQMTRFLFPLVPVLMLYAFCFVQLLARRIGRPTASAALLALLVATLAAPGLAFLYQRSRAPEPHAGIIDWYRTPDLAAARTRSSVHLDLEADMRAIRAHTQPGDRVMWVAPAYVALLASRHGVAAPPSWLPPARYRAEVDARRPDFIYLSAYHPRDTIRDSAWRTGRAALEGWGEIVHARPGAVLLKRRD
jgi:uncharacterized membrane protein YfbV (UPF0208 family)